MSATNRGAVREDQDAYVTPDWCIKRLFERYRPPCRPQGAIWLDPFAANGRLISVVRSMMPERHMSAIELRPECAPELEKVCGPEGYWICDFLEAAKGMTAKSVDVITTNHPYSLTNESIAACTSLAHISIMLMRINAIRGDGRHTLMKELNPGLLVLPDRPSFTGWGMDATEYAWFVFGDPALAGRWDMLDETSKEEKAAWNAYARTVYPKPEKETV